MDTSKIAARYSKALFSAALENNALQEVKNDMHLLLDGCRDTDFVSLLMNPLMESKAKFTVIENIYGEYTTRLTMDFIKLLTCNGREEKLESIARWFIRDYRRHMGIKSVELTTNRPVDKHLKEKIVSLVKSNYQCDVDLIETTKDEIMGGFILNIEGLRFDASVATRLDRIKTRFLMKSLQ